MNEIVTILGIIAAYTLLVLFIGLYSYRYSKPTMEDYHMASREFSFLVLFCAIFGTNISAVALIGGPGKAYHVGWIVWAYFVTSWGWLSPLLFYTVGHKAWPIAKKFGLMTISDLLYKRWDSRFLSYLASAFLIFYTLPYVMTGVIGGGRTFQALTHGFIPYWVGALIVTFVVCLYVAFGGMRGTAWTNTLQTFVFLIGGIVMFFLVAEALGGFSKATQLIAEKYPHLLSREKFPMRLFFSYGIIVSLAVPMFPQVYIRLLTGRHPRELKKTILIYPLAAMIIWFIVAYIGMWGHLAFPGLAGAASDKILPMLIAKYTPVWATGLLGAAIFAALMSSLDAQLLTMGTMLIKDFFLGARKKAVPEKTDISFSRFLVIVLAFVAFGAALIKPKAIITIIEWSFGGYACMIIPVLACLYWKRANKYGAICSILASQFVLIAIPLGALPRQISFGMLPGVPALIVGTLVLLIVTYLTPAPEENLNKNFFSL